MKVEYSFYTGTYGGTKISEDSWKRFSQKAEQRLCGYTYGRCSGDWEGENWCNLAKCAVCEMSEILFDDEKRGGKTSENTDGYAVSYDAGNGKTVASMLYDVARVYLADTGLMYAGVDARC